MRAWKSSMLSKTTARPRCRSRCGDAAAGLISAPSGARLPRSTAMPPSATSGADAGPDHLGVPDRGVVEVVDQRPAGDGQRGRVEQVADLAQHGEQAAGAVEVLHQEPAGRLQVDQHRHPRSRSGRSRPASGRCRAGRRSPAGGRRRWWTRRSRPARRSRCGRTPWSGTCSAAGRRRPSRRPAGRCRARPPAAGCPAAGVPATPGHDGAERLGDQRHRRGGAHRVAVPAAADHRRLGAGGSLSCGQRARPAPPRTAATRRCRSRAARRGRCRSASARRARRRPAGRPRRRPSAATGWSCRSRRAARRRRSGWPAASPRSPSRPCCATASRSAAPASRRATRPAAPAGCRRPRSTPFAHRRGDLGQVRVARGQVRGGVRDGDLRPAGEGVVGHTAAHPGPVDVGVAVAARRTTGRCGAPRRPAFRCRHDAYGLDTMSSGPCSGTSHAGVRPHRPRARARVQEVAGAGRRARRGRRRRRAGRRLRHRRRVLHRRDGLPARRPRPLPDAARATSGPARSSAVGAGVDPGWLGRRVTGDTMLGDGTCRRCRRGHQHVCARPAGGRHPRRPARRAGRAARRAGVVAARAARRGRRRRSARWSSPAATRCAPSGRPALGPGDRVLVLGPGTIGLLDGDVRPRGRAPRCTCWARPARSLAFARSLGFEHAWTADDAARRCPSTRSSTRPTRAHLPARALELVEPAGRVVYIGLAGQPEPASTPGRWCSRTSPRSASCPPRPASAATIAAYAARRGRPAAAGRRHRRAGRGRRRAGRDAARGRRTRARRSTSTHDRAERPADRTEFRDRGDLGGNVTYRWVRPARSRTRRR